MTLPEDGTCYTYLMLLKQQRCAGCSRTERIHNWCCPLYVPGLRDWKIYSLYN